jgi:hypothetical protein
MYKQVISRYIVDDGILGLRKEDNIYGLSVLSGYSPVLSAETICLLHTEPMGDCSFAN